MHFASMRLELRLPACQSTRQRRHLLEAMIAKLRSHFNVAAAEVDTDGPDVPTAAAIGLVSVGRSCREAREPLEQAAAAIAAHPQAEITGHALTEF